MILIGRGLDLEDQERLFGVGRSTSLCSFQGVESEAEVGGPKGNPSGSGISGTPQKTAEGTTKADRPSVREELREIKAGQQEKAEPAGRRRQTRYDTGLSSQTPGWVLGNDTANKYFRAEQTKQQEMKSPTKPPLPPVQMHLDPGKKKPKPKVR